MTKMQLVKGVYNKKKGVLLDPSQRLVVWESRDKRTMRRVPQSHITLAGVVDVSFVPASKRYPVLVNNPDGSYSIFFDPKYHWYILNYQQLNAFPEVKKNYDGSIEVHFGEWFHLRLPKLSF